MPKESDDLSREGEPTQETEKAKLKIPVPKKREFEGLLERAAKRDEKKRPSRSDPPSR